MAIMSQQILQDTQRTISTGDSLMAYNASFATIAISGTSTSFTVQFEGSIDGGDTYFPIDG